MGVQRPAAAAGVMCYNGCSALRRGSAAGQVCCNGQQHWLSL